MPQSRVDMSGDTIENGDEGTSSSSRLDSILLDDFGEFCEELMVPVGGRRTMCQRCVRPSSTCLCAHLPSTRLASHTRLLILQHPREETRGLRTVPLLQACLEEESVDIARGAKFPIGRCKVLDHVLAQPDTLLLYPAKQAVDISSAPPPTPGRRRTLIVLDGTWAQAKGMFVQNLRLRDVPSISLSSSHTSEYIIRTQPTDAALSTLESAGLALSILDNNPDIFEAVLRPLRALCDIQLQHGANVHHSKETLLRMQEQEEATDTSQATNDSAS